MDAFISRGMVGQGSTTKDWFKSTDRFEQEIGAEVNRLDGLKTFADCFRVQDARLTLTYRSFSYRNAAGVSFPGTFGAPANGKGLRPSARPLIRIRLVEFLVPSALRKFFSQFVQTSSVYGAV